MSLSSFITLGRSGLRVSPFCLGSMTFGEDLGWGASVADSEAMIAAYLERGGNFIDAANSYTNGHPEKIIGDFFAQAKGHRDRVVIGTKFFCSLFEGDPNGGGAGGRAEREGSCGHRRALRGGRRGWRDHCRRRPGLGPEPPRRCIDNHRSAPAGPA
jgi:aryl-alcohol dehydrogenase-like predicted oxidoreductase